MKQKHLYFYELTVGGLVSALLHRLLGWKVGYFRISPFLSGNWLFNRLDRLGFDGISYDPLPVVNIRTKAYTKAFKKIFSDHIAISELHTAIDSHFDLGEKAQDYVWSGLRQSLQMKWFEFSLIGCQLQTIGEGGEVYWRALPSGMARTVGRGIQNFPTISGPSLAEYLGFAASLAYRFASRILAAIARRAHIGWQERGEEQAEASPIPCAAEYEIIYFPHKGVAYGTLFAKDQYYSNVPESPFRAQNILHLAASREDEPSQESLQYYIREQIPFDNLDRYMESGFRWELRTAIEFLQIARRACAINWNEIWRWQGYRLAAYYYVFRALKRNIHTVSLLRGARLALVGYDVLFSPWLAAALANAGIRTVATQERFILPFYTLLDAFVDVYLVSGPPVKAVIERNPELFVKKEIVVIGPPRADDIRLWNLRDTVDQKYYIIKKKRFLILALDYVAPRNPDSNRMARATTWNNIRAFYIDLLQLAEAYPDVHIVLKGKDASNKENPYLADLVCEIERKENIEIEVELNTYLPAYMAGIADMAIAMHTSLGEEMLAAGKPCLFYDRMGYLRNIYEYEGFPVIVRSYDELEHSVGELIRKGAQSFMDSSTFSSLRSTIFGEDGFAVRERIQIQLKRIFEECRLARDLQSIKGDSNCVGVLN